MTHTKQSAWFKSGVRVLVILVLLVVPASLLAWFCGTGRMTGGGKLLQCTSDGSTCVDVTGCYLSDERGSDERLRTSLRRQFTPTTCRLTII